MCGVCGKINKDFLCKKCEIILRKHEVFSIEQYNNRNFDSHLYMFKYEGIIRKILLNYKFKDSSYLYKTFANFLLKNYNLFENLKKYDTIIPVPISKKRKNERGFNQSHLIAKEIAKSINIECENKCLFKVLNIIEQSKLNKEERKNNIQGVYKLKNKNRIYGKNILLFDDIYTTGSTVNECCRILKESKPKIIDVFTIAKD